MSFLNFLDEILSISMHMQLYFKIFHKVEEIGPGSLLPNFDLGKVSTNDKLH